MVKQKTYTSESISLIFQNYNKHDVLIPKIVSKVGSNLSIKSYDHFNRQNSEIQYQVPIGKTEKILKCNKRNLAILKLIWFFYSKKYEGGDKKRPLILLSFKYVNNQDMLLKGKSRKR